MGHDTLWWLQRSAQNQLMEGWKKINSERVPASVPQSKKVAIFKVTNILFKVYFQLKTWELCKNIVNVIERQDSESYINQLHLFPTVSRFCEAGTLI